MGGDPKRGTLGLGANQPKIDKQTLIRQPSPSPSKPKEHSGLCFPLPVRSTSYQKKGMEFGHTRGQDKRRKHAGCDLLAREKTKVLAMQDGTVVGFRENFLIITKVKEGEKSGYYLDGCDPPDKYFYINKTTKQKEYLTTEFIEGVKHYVLNAEHKYRKEDIFHLHALAVRHKGFFELKAGRPCGSMPIAGFIVRYCEINSKLRRGDRVYRGSPIGEVAKQNLSMLHIEMYRGIAEFEGTPREGKLEGTGDYKRRSDLIDPAPYLDIAVSVVDLRKEGPPTGG